MALFPGETVLFLRTADARELIERFQDTGLPKMSRDPALAGFAESIEGSLRDSYAEKAEGVLGLDFDTLMRLPQGEIAFALVERRGEDPALLLLADFREEGAAAENLLEKAKESVTESGGVVGEEPLRVDTAVTLREGKNQSKTVGVVRRGAVFVAATDPALLSSVLDRWDGVTTQPPGDAAEEAAEPKYIDSLDKNRAFASCLRECLKGREEPPQAIAFVNPIAMVRATAGRQTPVRIGLAMLPALGVDAVEGAAAATWFANDSWDTLIRGHLLVDNPRAGVMQILRLQGGEVAPPDYVPADVSNYTTVNINPQQVYGDITAVVDRLRFEGAFSQLVQSTVSQRLGVDLPTEVLPLLTGRVSMMGGFEEEGRGAIGHTLLAFEVNDEQKAQELLTKFLEHQKAEGRMRDGGQAKQFGEVSYTLLPAGSRRRNRGDDAESQGRPRLSPCVGLFGGALIVTSSEELFQRMVSAHEGTAPRLADDLQYRLVSSRLERLAGGNPIGLWSYENAEESMRHWYRLLKEDSTREFLDRGKNPVLAAVRAGLDAGELPPVEDLVKYCTPSGSIVYDTQTGFHYLAFRFQSNAE